MARKNLETNINIRLNLDDMNVLKKQAEKLRVPIFDVLQNQINSRYKP